MIGTSLQVQPFASLVNQVRSDVPRVLINREAVGPFEYSSAKKAGGRDTFWEGNADEGVRVLAEELGWTEELEEMIKEGKERLTKEWEEMERNTGHERAKKAAENTAEEVKEAVEVGGDDELGDLQKAIERKLDLGRSEDDKAKI